MKSNVFWAVVILAGISLAVYTGCDRVPPRVGQVEYKPSASAKKAMELYDTNKDGKITGEELLKAPGLMAALHLFGTDPNKGVTAAMIEKRIQSWIDSKVARQPLMCTFYDNNGPLVGADIKFVPEPIIADGFKDKDGKTLIGTGKTSNYGMAMVTWPTSKGQDGDPPGIGPGFYRIEVTKAGANIPAKYNTATELGQEFSSDNPQIQGGLKYMLQY